MSAADRFPRCVVGKMRGKSLVETRSSKSESWAVRVALAAMLSYALMVPSMTLSAEAARQEAAEDDAKDEGELDEVNITGTRIQIPGNYTAPNPLTTIDAEELRRQGIVNVSDALLQLVPQNISAYTPALTGDDQ